MTPAQGMASRTPNQPGERLLARKKVDKTIAGPQITP